MGTRLAIDWQAPGLRSRNRTCARWRAHCRGHHRPNDCISAPPGEPASATATEARKERGRVSKSRSISLASLADSSLRTMARFQSARRGHEDVGESQEQNCGHADMLPDGVGRLHAWSQWSEGRLARPDRVAAVWRPGGDARLSTIKSVGSPRSPRELLATLHPSVGASRR